MEKISFRKDVLPLKDMLFRLALRITLNRAEAEDIVQDTMIKVWNKRDTWNQIESIEAFCTTICRNLSLDRAALKENLNQSIDTEGDFDQADNAEGPYERAIQHDRMELVRSLIDSLPEKQRSCMQLRDIEGKAYKDIAAALGITEEQVKVNIFRARQAVKQKFKEYDEYGL